MSLNLYDLTVPILTRALEAQLSFLKKGEQHCKDNGIDPSKLVEGRIAPDMLVRSYPQIPPVFHPPVVPWECGWTYK